MTDTGATIIMLICTAAGAGFFGSLIGDGLLAFLRWKGWWPERRLIVQHEWKDESEPNQSR